MNQVATRLVGLRRSLVRLGAAGSSTYSGQTLTPYSHSYQLGGGNGTLTLTTALAGANSVNINGPVVLTNASNSYSAATIVNSGGTLSISSLPNAGTGGADSQLGSSSNAAANLVFNGGTLLYTGSGGSTDRLFTLSTSSTISASGTGPALFGVNGGMLSVPGSSSVALTLAGTNTGLNTLAAAIADPSGGGQTTLNKTGVGAWVLSANNTFSGGINVGGGTLAGTASTTPGGSPFGATGPIAISGGKLQLNPSASSTQTTTIGAISTSGGATVSINWASGYAATGLAAASLSQTNSGGTVVFNIGADTGNGSTTTLGAQTSVAFGNAPSAANGILAPWAIGQLSGAGNASGDFLSTDNTGKILVGAGSSNSILGGHQTLTAATTSTPNGVFAYSSAASMTNTGIVSLYALKLSAAS